jgi:hypothetical protein
MRRSLNSTAKNQQLTIDASTGSFDPTPSTIHLKTADEVRLEMAKVYREMRGNRIDISDGCKLVYVLGQLCKIIETSEVQKRIEAVERILSRRK